MREITWGTLLRTLVLGLFVGIALPYAIKHVTAVDSSYWWYISLLSIWFPLAALVLAWRDSVLHGITWWWGLFPPLIFVVTGATQPGFWVASMVIWALEMMCCGAIGTYFGSLYYNRRIARENAAKQGSDAAKQGSDAAKQGSDAAAAAADSHTTAKATADDAAKPAAGEE